MITNLKIQNYALIDNLDITFEKGFSVITGETGAGKSIILGALSMILGQRADAKYVKTGEKKCVIEAHINIDGYGLEGFFDDNDIEYDASDCILRREITCAGKSRAFINDTPVSLATLRDIGERLVDIHSQHQNLMLGNSNFQLSVIDIISDNTKALASYQEAYKIFKEEEEKLTNMEKLLEESRTQEDYMRFQLAELEDAKLADTGEEEILEQKAETMNHAEEIKNSLYIAETQLDDDDNGILTKMRRIAGELSSISNLIPNSNSLADRINSAHIELKDISSEIRALMDNIEFVPSELQEINDRLDLLYSLEKKYRCEDIDGLISIRDNIKTTLSLIDNSEESIKTQKEIVARAKTCRQLVCLAKEISQNCREGNKEKTRNIRNAQHEFCGRAKQERAFSIGTGRSHIHVQCKSRNATPAYREGRFWRRDSTCHALHESYGEQCEVFADNNI